MLGRRRQLRILERFEGGWILLDGTVDLALAVIVILPFELMLDILGGASMLRSINRTR